MQMQQYETNCELPVLLAGREQLHSIHIQALVRIRLGFVARHALANTRLYLVYVWTDLPLNLVHPAFSHRHIFRKPMKPPTATTYTMSDRTDLYRRRTDLVKQRLQHEVCYNRALNLPHLKPVRMPIMPALVSNTVHFNL